MHFKNSSDHRTVSYLMLVWVSVITRKIGGGDGDRVGDDDGPRSTVSACERWGCWTSRSGGWVVAVATLRRVASRLVTHSAVPPVGAMRHVGTRRNSSSKSIVLKNALNLFDAKQSGGERERMRDWERQRDRGGARYSARVRDTEMNCNIFYSDSLVPITRTYWNILRVGIHT